MLPLDFWTQPWAIAIGLSGIEEEAIGWLGSCQIMLPVRESIGVGVMPPRPLLVIRLAFAWFCNPQSSDTFGFCGKSGSEFNPLVGSTES